MKDKQVKVEFHVHTRFSKDSIFPLWLMLLKCKIKGINKIGITDHNRIDGALIARRKFKKHNIDVIVGEEIFTEKGEVIGLFLNHVIPAKMSVKDTIEEIKKQHGVIVIPHPYDEKRYKTVMNEEDFVDFIDDIDAIEFHNGRNNKSFYSDRQSEISKRYNKNYIIGSDAHTVFELGRNNGIMPDFSTPDELRHSLKVAKWTKRKCIVWIHLYTKFVRVFKKVFRWK